jgi:hypothetical protein
MTVETSPPRVAGHSRTEQRAKSAPPQLAIDTETAMERTLG